MAPNSLPILPSPHIGSWLDAHAGPLMSWCVLVAAAAIAGHLVFRLSGFPRMLGYTVVGLLAGWLGFGDLPWPLQGNTQVLLQTAVGTSLLMAASQVSLPWLLRQPWLLLQSFAESVAALVLVTGVLQLLGMGWAVSLGVGVVAMAASPAVLLRVVADLRASGAVTDRSLLLATLSGVYALVLGLVMTVAWSPAVATGGGAEDALANLVLTATGLGQLLMSLGLTVLWAMLTTVALWPVLRWQSSRSDSTALYMLAALVAVSLLATRWGGSAALGFLVAGLLLRNMSPKPLVWPSAFMAANTMLSLLMFVLVASMAGQVVPSVGLVSVIAAAALARLVGKMGGVLLLGLGTGLGWQRQWPVACAQSPSSGLALVLASALALQWAVVNAGVAGALTAIALPMVVLCEVLGVLLASLALWRSGEAHRGIGLSALNAKEKRHDA